MERPSDKIRLVILKGSVRPGNYTGMAAALVEEELKKHPRVSVETIDPAQLDLPLPGTASRSNDVEQLHRKVAEAAGAVLATPEYHGSFSSVMKLLIENLGHPSPIFGKPVALLGVAGGTIGAIKAVAHMIHDRFYCTHRYAAATRLAARFPQPSGQARRSVGRHTVSSMPSSLAVPRARLAWRLGGFVTNRHESCGLGALAQRRLPHRRHRLAVADFGGERAEGIRSARPLPGP
ncbi:NADPH-dependent FMN reductase [Nitrospira sp. BLG_2]|uniref:NADPH-dependent FMN reductase n=1 Tax=Nitrospira sp. BLG_2 TaxID=3397507 RepID=UPI003B9B6017